MRYDLAENYDLTDRLRGWPGFRIGAAAGLVTAAAWVYQVDLVPAVVEGDAFGLGIGLHTVVVGLLVVGWIWGLLFRLNAGVSWAAGAAVTTGLAMGLVAALDVFFGWGVDWQIGRRGLVSPEDVQGRGSGPAMLAGVLWTVSAVVVMFILSFVAAALGATMLRRLAKPWAARVVPRLAVRLPESWQSGLGPHRGSSPLIGKILAQEAARSIPEGRRIWRTVYGRAVLVLLYGVVVLSQLWVEPVARIDAALIFGIFAVFDGALLLMLARTSRAFAPARLQLRAEAAVSIVIGLVAAGISIGSGRQMTLDLFYGLIAAWAVLTALAQLSVAFALRHGISAHLLILYTVLIAVTRFVYGIEAAAAPEVMRLAYAQSLILMGVVVLIAMLHGLTGNALRRWPASEFEAARRPAGT